MVVAIGVNRANGRRAVLLTIEPADVVRLREDCIVLNTEDHIGFPDDLEVVLNVGNANDMMTLFRESGSISSNTQVVRDGKL